MKTIFKLSIPLFFIIIASCTNDQTITDQTYVFTKPYCATVTVGGVVGLAEKCFKIGDIVSGKEINAGKITIRIAEHSSLNDGPPSSASYQEFLDVPLNYLELKK
ncbi:hypothetical protein [Flavobacterium nackdongense]|uniref:Uncharacterized protein n=1 Tax=Flavobacterium nackdongense TaxID=2547394 RepID=A0A4P6YCU5_9FLAO|nr:hypothetical protein [Flavobacterium nackdongense]QBN20088.1 hypothetical protein E1750_15210 [Flavobacterium nackdongense]